MSSQSNRAFESFRMRMRSGADWLAGGNSAVAEGYYSYLPDTVTDSPIWCLDISELCP